MKIGVEVHRIGWNWTGSKEIKKESGKDRERELKRTREELIGGKGRQGKGRIGRNTGELKGFGED